ncbi:hypothetical protein Tco_1162917 [Tanacetum coccineum]
MANLKFADTHNMVAFLAKPAKMDGKKIIITESIVRRDLQLEDAEGVDCLPNATIFEQLTLMGSKTTAWKEFSSTMASAIICLATNQKFNFSKYIFESMVKNLDNAGKFLMYPRKRFSRRETSLFQKMVVQDQAKIGEGSAIPTDPHHTPTFIQPSTSQPQKKQKPRKPKRKNTKIPQSSGPTDNVAHVAINEEVDDSLVRAATTATSLDAEQDRGSGTRCQEAIGDTIAQTRFENVSKHSNIPLLVRDEGLGKEDASKQGRIADIDANEDIYLVNVQTDEDMFGVNDLDGDEVIVESVDVVNTAEETRSVVEEVTVVTIPVSAATTTTITTAITDVEMTLAQALAELKSANPKADKEQVHTPTVSSQQPSQVKVQDKGKGKIVKPEPVKKMSKKELLRLDEELAFKLQAEEEEEERLAREKA